VLVHILANLSSEPVPLPLIESEMHASVNAGAIDILGHAIDSRQTEQGKWRYAYRPVHTLDRRGDLFVQARHCCGLDRALGLQFAGIRDRMVDQGRDVWNDRFQNRFIEWCQIAAEGEITRNVSP
jgi:hypothetical protein